MTMYDNVIIIRMFDVCCNVTSFVVYSSYTVQSVGLRCFVVALCDVTYLLHKHDERLCAIKSNAMIVILKDSYVNTIYKNHQIATFIYHNWNQFN